MEAPEQFSEDVGLRRYDYGDAVVIAADLGLDEETAVDVVDDTVVVVVGDEQYDLEAPAGDAEAFIRNGVLTIEVRE